MPTRKSTAVPASLLLFLACSSSVVRAGESLEVALNWVADGDHAPLYYAKKLGWYSKAGIDVDLQAGKGSVGSIQRVSVGTSPIGLADMAVVLSAVGKGANVTAIFDIYANTALGMYWLKSSGITGVKDFPGRRIGVPAGDAQRALWPDPKRMESDYQRVSTYIGIDKPFDVKTAYTNQFLDPSIKMIEAKEP